MNEVTGTQAKIALLIAISMLALGGHGALATDDDETVLDFRYGGERLFVSLSGGNAGDPLDLKYAEVDDRGRRMGRFHHERLPMSEDRCEAVLSKMSGVAHDVTISRSGWNVRLFANRGTWYLAGTGSHHALSQKPIRLIPAAFETERLLATGGTVRLGRTGDDRDVIVGRTFGPDDGFGVRLEKKERALVFSARATGQMRAVMISIAERLGPTELRYRDYPLILDDTASRYEIPFEKFKMRNPTDGRSIAAIHAVSFRNVQPIAAGDTLEIDYIAVGPGAPVVRDIRRFHRADAVIRLGNRGAKAAATIHAMNASGKRDTIPIRGKEGHAPKTARAIWICSRGRDGDRCDPPDAPRTRYGFPFDPDAPLDIDGFDTPLPINRFRLPTAVFAADTALEKQLGAERLEGTLRITYYPTAEADYAGYVTELPRGAADGYQTLAVTLRGSLPPNFLQAGIKNQDGLEARIPFISYWSGEETAANPLYDFKEMNRDQVTDNDGFRTVRFPIAAFRAVFHNVFEGHAALSDISGVSVTMNFGGGDIFHEIELKQIAMTHERVPIVVTAFDNEHYGINSLGGVNFSEDKNGAHLDVRLNSDGFYGKGLRTEVALPNEAAFGLVAFGFGRLDVSNYERLSFMARGEFGGEDAAVYLNDGRHRTKVQISEVAALGRMWRKVVVPLSTFSDEGVRLDRLTQLILAFEDRYISRQILYFDNFMFE